MAYDPNCAWWDFSCTSNPNGCAWYDPLCTIGTDINNVVQPTITKVLILGVVVVIGIVILAWSPLGKRVPLPRFS